MGSLEGYSVNDDTVELVYDCGCDVSVALDLGNMKLYDILKHLSVCNGLCEPKTLKELINLVIYDGIY